MRKVLVTLALMAIAMGMVFAEAAAGNVNGTDVADLTNGAKLTVTLDMVDDDNSKYFEIGFTSKALADDTVPTAANPVTPLETVALTERVEGGEMQNTANSAYVYYIVKGAAVKISLGIADALKATGDETGIDWQVVANGKTISSTGDAVEIEDNIGSSGVTKVKSYPLSISTVGLLSDTTVKAEYSGDLVVSIATVQ